MRVHRPLRLLDAAVIHRIAAGEVVDRPASILKELIENSLDAEATKIKVTLLDGGLKSIQVEDDGIGIPKDDLSHCVQRHATSKISVLDDLDSIHSLGFRGEALSAAASVSQLVIETFTAADGAWVLEVVGGDRKEIRPGTHKIGTKVSVNDLFFNIPARRKFLKRPGAEAHECSEVLESLALAHPQIFFEWYLLSEKGEIKKQSRLEAATLPERFLEISGLNADVIHLQKEDSENAFPRIEIVAAKAPASSQVQKSIRLSVNGRAVIDKRLPYALREAYAGLIEVGHFPHIQINLEVDPSMIDVNIHPQKKELRWPQGVSVASKVYALLRPQFEVKAPVEIPKVEQGDIFSSAFESSIEVLTTTGLSSPSEAAFRSYEASPKISASPALDQIQIYTEISSARPSFRFSSLRVVGEVGAAWIVGESERGLVLIDQHAAHERVNFEKILSSQSLLRSRLLLVPIEVEIPYHLSHAKAEIIETLETLKFEFSDQSEKDKLEILAAPESDRKVSWDDVIKKVFRALSEEAPLAQVLAALKTRLAASLACHGSVRRGQRLTVDSIQALLRQMDEVQWGCLCPHGRPLWFEMSHEKIADLFHR